MRRIGLITMTILLVALEGFSQVYTNKIVGEKNQALKDSLEKQEYPYILPIWGKKATAKGFQLPYSAGLGVTYLWQRSDLTIENLMVGFNNGPMYDLDEVIRFNDAISESNGVNLRPDFWLFPFLNIYGVFAGLRTSTTIDAGVWLPDTSNTWTQVSTISTKAEFDAVTFGFGMTPTVGVGGGWLALDMNVAWTDVSALDKPVFTFVFGPRVGKTFKFRKPDMNINGWVGGFRLNYESGTSGSLNMADLIDTEDIQTTIDEGLAKVDETSKQVEDWWDDLEPEEQQLPSNKAKYESANRAIEAAGNIFTAADQALNDENQNTVQYSLDKAPKNKWNFIVGSQFQINRHFMVRAEYGFLGTRHQFLAGLQYRFGL